MSSAEDQKLLKKMEKEEQKIMERNERIENGTASANEIRLFNKELNELAKKVLEDKKASDEAAKRRREDEPFERLRQIRQRMDMEYEADFGGDDSMWVDDDQPVVVERVERVHNRAFNPKKPRKQFWVEHSATLIAAFIESYKKCEEPDFRLEQPLEVEKPAGCDCVIRGTKKLTGYMFGGTCEFSVNFCDHQSLVETLVLCQMLPTATVRPESAIHFSVFEYGRIAKLDGSVSNHKFTKMYNSWCLQRSGFSNDFVPLDASVYNALQVIFRDVYKHAMDRLHEENLLALQVGCYACHGAERKLVSMDGNFSWRRRKDRRPANNSNSEQGIFAPSRAEIALIAPPNEVDRFDDQSEVTDEECLLRDLDSDFKAGADHRRQDTSRFDECGVFSLNCARHGIVERVFDIFSGEGRKYALAAVDHVVKNLESDQKLGVMYDIMCLCQKRIEQTIPLVQQHDPIYGVAIFHALAHSVSCQAKYFPRYVKGMALTDGESVERVWSHCNHFVGMSRNMSKANRHALLTQVLQHYADDKADSLASYIAKKYKKVIKKLADLNITIEEYRNLEQEWLKHADNLGIRPDSSGLEQLQSNAETVEALQNKKVYYLVLVAQYLTLVNKEGRSKFTGYHVERMRKSMLLKIRQMEQKHGYIRPKNFKDPLFVQYHVEVKDCRYNALNNYLTHLLFAIIIREKKLRSPAGSSGTAKAARISISLIALTRVTELVIGRINALVQKFFGGAEDKSKLSVGREVEKLRTSAQGDNILGLSDALTNWHLLNRHVEEAELLIEEARRFIANLEQEHGDLERALSRETNPLLKRKFLQTSRRLHMAEKALQQVVNQTAPTITLTPAPFGSTNDLVVVGCQEVEQDIEAGVDGSDDDDFEEGDNDEAAEDVQEVLREIKDASLDR